jgi:hypothetical protein
MIIPARWKANLTILLYIATLLWVNVYISRDLFSIEFTRHLQSNEGTFIAIARVIIQHPTDLLWWPFWNIGMPFQNTYFPLLPLTNAAAAQLAGCSPALAFHAVCAIFYCLGPVAVFLMAWKLSRAPGYSFIAALAYSLLSPSAFLAGALRNDLGAVWGPRRLQAMVYYGESPHVASLALLPLAVLVLCRCFQGRRSLAPLAGLLMSAVALMNAFGGVTLAIALLCLLQAGESRDLPRNAGFAAVTGALAYLWMSPWIPPSVLNTIRQNSQLVGGDFRPRLPTVLAALAVLGGLALLGVLMRRLHWPFHLKFFLLFTAALAAITLPAFYWDVFLLPQPHRYSLELEMALCLLVVFAIRQAAERWSPKAKVAVGLALIVPVAHQVIHYRRYAKALIQPVEITKTSEYKVAQWIDQNLKGQRVMVSGSWSLWFNIFSDNPQLSGGHEPMAPNWVQRVAVYTLYTGENAGDQDAAISVLWLKALGNQAIAVPGANSQESYHPFRNPRKFEGVLPVLWREGGDTIYRVPQRSLSLAHVIPASALAQRTPKHGLDVDPLVPYVAAIGDAGLPEAELRWHDLHSGVIRAPVHPGQVISVQITYDPGWRASVRGSQRPVDRDGLGMLVIRPECNGPCEIELFYDGGLERKITRALSWLVTIGVPLGYAIRRRISIPFRGNR